MADRQSHPTPPAQQRPRSPRSGQVSSVQITFAVILAVGLILAINFSSRISVGQPLMEAYDSIQTEIVDLEREQATLIAERDYARSDAYVEEWARDDGKMIRPGEKLVIPVPSGIIVNATPTPIPQAAFNAGVDEPAPWQLWWAMFFDSPPPNNVDTP